jgi:hypothetical protein
LHTYFEVADPRPRQQSHLVRGVVEHLDVTADEASAGITLLDKFRVLSWFTAGQDFTLLQDGSDFQHRLCALQRLNGRWTYELVTRLLCQLMLTGTPRELVDARKRRKTPADCNEFERELNGAAHDMVPTCQVISDCGPPSKQVADVLPPGWQARDATVGQSKFGSVVLLTASLCPEAAVPQPARLSQQRHSRLTASTALLWRHCVVQSDGVKQLA